MKSHSAMSELRMLLHYMSCDKSKRVWNGYGYGEEGRRCAFTPRLARVPT